MGRVQATRDQYPVDSIRVLSVPGLAASFHYLEQMRMPEISWIQTLLLPFRIFGRVTGLPESPPFVKVCDGDRVRAYAVKYYSGLRLLPALCDFRQVIRMLHTLRIKQETCETHSI
jgi:hypothetical protein